MTRFGEGLLFFLIDVRMGMCVYVCLCGPCSRECGERQIVTCSPGPPGPLALC